MNKVKYLIFVVIMLAACAQQNDPFQPDSVLQVDTYYKTGGFARDFAISDSMLFVAADQAGFSIFNRQNGQKISNYYETFENARLIDYVERDSLLFIYDRYGDFAGIRIFDISQPSLPGEEMLLTGRGVDAMRCFPNEEGNVDIMATSYNKIKYGEFDGVFWYSYSTSFPNAVAGFDLDADNYYVCGEQMGIYIADRQSGEMVTIYDTPGSSLAVKKVDNLLYVANKQEGISIIDITDLQQPVEIFWQNTSGYAQNLDVYGNYLVVASGGGGAYLFDVKDPENAELIDRIDDDEIGYVYQVRFFEGAIYAATKRGVYKLKINI
jgi:hypothetical protein